MPVESESNVLGALKGLYLKQLKERLYALEQAMLDLRLTQGSNTNYEMLEYEVHRLNGTGATYGFPKISKAADALECHLRSGAIETPEVIRLLAVLIGEISETLQDGMAGMESHEPVLLSNGQDGVAAYRPAVLVVDDDPAILNLVLHLISSWANVECASNGAQAIEALDRRRFDLVVLDYELPDMSGLDVLTRINQSGAAVRSPVMMLSATREPAKVSRLIAAGAQHYVVKPLTPAKFIDRLSFVLNRQKKIVMVVDDDPLIREIFRKRFEQRGYEVVLATNGVQALRMVLEIQPQAIVLDRQMPRMDGIQVLQELRRKVETRNTPVVMLSAMARSDDMYSGYREGADAYIAKPFLPDQVVECCEGLLRPLDMAAQIASTKASWANSAYV
jgi:DNA-binding response OmpR family regulator